MLFYKPLVSFVVAFVAASSVAAAASPLARTNLSPPSPSAVNQCDSAKTYCCNTWTNADNPALPLTSISALLGHKPDADLIQALDCTRGGTCNTQKLCCPNSYQGSSLITLQCVPINANV